MAFCNTICINMNKKIFLYLFLFPFISFADSTISSNECEQAKHDIRLILNRVNSAVGDISSNVADINWYASLETNVYHDALMSAANDLIINSNDISVYATEIASSLNDIQCHDGMCSIDLTNIETNLHELVTGFSSFVTLYNSFFAAITNKLSSSSIAAFDRFRYYAQGQSSGTMLELYPLSPYDSRQHMVTATIYDSIYGGFASSLIALGSLNNYMKWFKDYYNSHGQFTFDYSSLSSLGDISTNTESIDDSLDTYLDLFTSYSTKFSKNKANYASLVGSHDQLHYYIATTGGKYSSVLSNPLQPGYANEFNTVSFFDVVYGGFTQNYITLASLNNYFHILLTYLETNSTYQLVNNISTSLANIASNKSNSAGFNIDGELLTNALKRVIAQSDYVTGVFSNKYNNLSLFWTTNFPSVLAYLSSISNDIRRLAYDIDTAYVHLFENHYKNVFEGTGEFDRPQDNGYYTFLTNRYILGEPTINYNPSNWFDRVETLLAALVFNESTTNLSDEVKNSQVLEQTYNQLGNYTIFQSNQNSLFNLAQKSSNSFLGLSYALYHQFSLLGAPVSIQLGWGDSDTTDYESLLGGHFRVTISHSRLDWFTEVIRSVTSIIWILISTVLIWKCSFWLCKKVYTFYVIFRQLLLSIWGKK